MNLGQIKTEVRSILNRRDVTDDQLTRWINAASQRARHLLRVPTTEKEVTITAPGPEPQTEFPVPADYLEMIEMSVANRTLDKIPYSRFLSLGPDVVGTPCYSLRRADRFVLWPAAQPGTQITLYYHGDASVFTDDSQSSALSNIRPYLFIYGALAYAGERFDDERRMEWDEKFAREIAELELNASMEAFSGGGNRVLPAYYEEA